MDNQPLNWIWEGAFDALTWTAGRFCPRRGRWLSLKAAGCVSWWSTWTGPPWCPKAPGTSSYRCPRSESPKPSPLSPAARTHQQTIWLLNAKPNKLAFEQLQVSGVTEPFWSLVGKAALSYFTLWCLKAVEVGHKNLFPQKLRCCFRVHKAAVTQSSSVVGCQIHKTETWPKINMRVMRNHTLPFQRRVAALEQPLLINTLSFNPIGTQMSNSRFLYNGKQWQCDPELTFDLHSLPLEKCKNETNGSWYQDKKSTEVHFLEACKLST